MLQLTQRVRARMWDEQSIFDSATSCQLMPYGQGNPRTGGNLRPELVSPRASRPEQGKSASRAQRDLIRFETRSVSYLCQRVD